MPTACMPAAAEIVANERLDGPGFVFSSRPALRERVKEGAGDRAFTCTSDGRLGSGDAAPPLAACLRGWDLADTTFGVGFEAAGVGDGLARRFGLVPATDMRRDRDAGLAPALGPAVPPMRLDQDTLKPADLADPWVLGVVAVAADFTCPLLGPL
mmetsp:Transcript_134888/g.319762  ORF Transcript_134888/g.319762 Transcript_134888/m.319762 type:complete len:155 (-) Transcript_134888:707-1171(-)